MQEPIRPGRLARRQGDRDWFKVHRRGLAQVLERRGKEFGPLELIQNAIDPDKTTRVDVVLVPVEGRYGAWLVVEDDDADGFADLTHAYTLFAPSVKAPDPEKRGRFNVGEKMVLALCESATIVSTTGGVQFTEEGRRSVRQRRERGSRFEGVMRMNREEIADCTRKIRELIVPERITLTLNGQEVPHRTALRSFVATLPTEHSDAEGNMRRTRRKTRLALYRPEPGETAAIYELGIPVVEHDGEWHVDVAQRVPLNFERDNVTPAFLRELRTAVLDNAYDALTGDAAASPWVAEALPHASDFAVREVVRLRFGEKVVANDPSDPEGTKLAVSQGYTVVPGGTFNRDEWRRIKEVGAVPPAGQVTPSAAVLCAPGGEPPVDEAEWTASERRVAEYARDLGVELLGVPIEIGIYSVANGKAAWYGARRLALNRRVLGRQWFEDPQPLEVDALLIHEFAHESEGDHLSERYHDALCKLGARLRRANAALRLGRLERGGSRESALARAVP